ncbi:hypothetical protein Francci3_3049 [Frankia casuarinae]|uniref:Uncharacterized protein n=2 Tax=Frankiaceae TaxID=74712 RepID=Q2J8I6_FRACC|nr:hypothetical protein Francci3_3049 [Frankia casuarinae]
MRAPGGSAGRMPSACHRVRLGLPLTAAGRSLAGQGPVAGAGGGPAADASGGPLPPLPTRTPQAVWDAAVADPDGPLRTRVVRGVRVAEARRAPVDPEGDRLWTVVVLDHDDDPVGTVLGFPSLDAADDYAARHPDILRWVSVPSRPAIPAGLPGP